MSKEAGVVCEVFARGLRLWSRICLDVDDFGFFL